MPSNQLWRSQNPLVAGVATHDNGNVGLSAFSRQFKINPTLNCSLAHFLKEMHSSRWNVLCFNKEIIGSESGEIMESGTRDAVALGHSIGALCGQRSCFSGQFRSHLGS